MTTRSFMRRLRALVSRSAVERELGDEMAFHLRMETEDLMRTHGVSRAEAERQARLRFGGIDRHTEAHRDARGVRWLEDAMADIRYACRALRRTPAFTVSAVLVLALGIGASTAIFSAVNAVIVSHLPYPHDEQLARIYNADSPTQRWSLALVEYRAIEARERTLNGVGAMVIREAPVAAGSAEPTLRRIAPLTASMFSTLGLRAAAGRLLLKSDEDQASAPVTVISDRFARATFGSVDASLGKSIDIDGAPSTVVGVLDPSVHEVGGFEGDIWPAYQPRTPTRRGPFGTVVIARIRNGASFEAASGDLARISKEIFPLWSSGFGDSIARFTPVPLRAAIIRDAPKTLWMFAGAALLLLLTGVMNVTNLMLARMTTRSRELSLRAVLGASRGRLARLVIVETTLLSALGAAFGIVASWLLLRLLIAIATTMPRIASATIDGRALGFAIGVGLLVGVAIGLYPVVSLVGGAARAAHSGNRDIGMGRGSSRLRGALVAAEFALALPLLAGAAQLIGSIAKLERVDPGFDPTHLAYTRVVLPSARYDSAARISAFWNRALEEVGHVPGVTAVGYSTELPPSDVGNVNDFLIADSPVTAGGASPLSPWLTVSPGYFDAMGARLIAGRTFNSGDTGDSVESLIVSESWVRHFSPDRPALGRRVFEGGCTAESCRPLYVVGVISDVKYAGIAQQSDAAYGPSTEGMSRAGYLMIRTAGDPSAVFSGVRRTLQSLDPLVPVDPVAGMTERMFASTTEPRHWTMLLAGFAVAALSLAAIGVFGLLSYLVTTMRREIGVRVALGAQRNEIVRMVINHGLMNAAAGAVVGLMIAVAGRQLIASFLYDVKPGDPLTLGAVTVTLLGVSVAASWVPARQAARIDPMSAIRSD